MGLLSRATDKKLLRTFVGYFEGSLRLHLHQVGPPDVSDVAHWIRVARDKTLFERRIPSDAELRLMTAGIAHASSRTGIDSQVLTQAFNIKMIQKNPRDREHRAALDAELAQLDKEFRQSQSRRQAT